MYLGFGKCPINLIPLYPPPFNYPKFRVINRIYIGGGEFNNKIQRIKKRGGAIKILVKKKACELQNYRFITVYK